MNVSTLPQPLSCNLNSVYFEERCIPVFINFETQLLPSGEIVVNVTFHEEEKEFLNAQIDWEWEFNGYTDSIQQRNSKENDTVTFVEETGDALRIESCEEESLSFTIFGSISQSPMECLEAQLITRSFTIFYQDIVNAYFTQFEALGLEEKLEVC
jgi:hypothetical protein